MEKQLIKDKSFITVDSGKREKFETGAIRDKREGKGRYDLIPPYPLMRLAALYERGAAKYNDNNWKLGIPISRCFDSALRHLMKFRAGETDEDHLTACIWNLFTIIDTERMIKENILPNELSDLFSIFPFPK